VEAEWERRGHGGESVRLDGARCLVVGGARRLGRVISLELAAAGADVAISSRTSGPEVDAARAAIADLGRRGLAVYGDVTAPPQVANLVTEAATALGGLDVLVYTASGPFEPAAPQDIDPASWQASFDIVARGFFLAACAAHDRFVAQDPPSPDAAPRVRGVIVALTDVLGIAPWAAFAAHGAAKAAQIMLVRSLAKAWAPEGIRVCGVAPGPVDLVDDPRREATVRAAARSASGRPVAPADVAAAIRSMVENDALTGVNLPADGGLLLA